MNKIPVDEGFRSAPWSNVAPSDAECKVVARPNRTTEPKGGIARQLDARRAVLLAGLVEAAMIPGIDQTVVGALRDKLAARTFNLVVAGEFKRGKSSVINALLGSDILPTGVVPLTSVVTVIHHGEPAAAVVRYETGTRETIALNKLADYVTERGNPHNEKQVREVEVVFPAPWLEQGIRLVDTPGIGSAYDHNTDATYAYLPQADAVIFVASVDQPVSRSELRFLADIRTYSDRIFCLLNKTDHLCATDLAEAVAFSAAALHEALDTDVPMFPVSARTALETNGGNDVDTLERSGFAAFDATLRRFLQRDSGEVLVHSVARNLARLLSGCRLAAELELRALAEPLQSLEENLRLFDARKAEALQQRSDFVAMLEADTRELVKAELEPDINRFKQSLAQRLDAEVPTWMREAADEHATSLQMALEQRSVAEVRRAFDTFRKQEDADIGAQFDRLCERFRQRIEQTADELMRASAELFAIRFEPVRGEHVRDAPTHFYYKFWQEPTGLTLLGHAMTTLLPTPLRRPLLLRRARRHVAELVEMQSGRLRHDFEQRIMRAMGVTRKQMLGRIETTIEAIATAVNKGRALKASGEEAATARRSEISELLGTIDVLATRMADM